ncbi:MAG TPA: NAD(P)/FAD-dependent oxidoreductase [Acidocella sp.]|uniref:NAD(P)/FAD-dependent oxidoreductase n=1 Tax=Acidocella sp. TaxID=50710 RepID=UPI002C5DE960|nr:NAD(P)/FAD-dependent oxidoreductase [Acidocella sp.]HVE21051.1 NAD(P)/FAD-dependent oxidoreductase [Acidocella sp.]
MAKTVFDVVVIGAGAAGLFCAATAARRGRRVLVLDHAAEPGAKILISGGGRCNFTNLSVKAENFLSANPHFAKSALAKFSSQDFIKLVEAHGIPYHEKRLGQLFCDDSARSILGLLLGLCRQNNVTLRLSQNITEISHDSGFTVKTGTDLVEATSLVLATGGLSIPKLGATGFTYEIARQFGLAMTPVKPGLVPLRFEGPQWGWMQGLSGVSFESAARFGKREFREHALFTHRGLSGPALLQISSYLPESPEAGELTLNMLPGADAIALLLERKAARPKAELKTILAELFPARLAQALLPEAQQKQIIAETPNKQLKELGERLNALRLRPTGTEGFAKAEVTVGGVDTAGLSSQTMGATKVPGLFVIGEAVDVTGWLGGYNFQWAWSSGFAAGEVA